MTSRSANPSPDRDDAGSAIPLLTLQGVSKRFVKPLDLADRLSNLMGARQREQIVHAVDGVDLSIAAGEVVGLVGESGTPSPKDAVSGAARNCHRPRMPAPTRSCWASR